MSRKQRVLSGEAWQKASTTVTDLLWRMKDNIGLEPAGPFRLITTILDHGNGPAAELAAAYTQGWEIETAFNELNTHQRGPARCCAPNHPTW